LSLPLFWGLKLRRGGQLFVFVFGKSQETREWWRN
jgi:hypothetical protein